VSRNKRLADVRLGSFSDFGPLPSLVGSSPNNGHAATASACPKSANTGSGAQPISAVAPLRVALRGIGNRGADANADAEEFGILVGCATNR
jgi:hypothetical protein